MLYKFVRQKIFSIMFCYLWSHNLHKHQKRVVKQYMSDPTHSKLSWILFFKSILGLWCIRRYWAASCKHFCLCIVMMFDRASTADWHHEEFRRFWFFSTWYTLSTFDNPSKNGNKSSSSVSVMSSNQEFTPTYNIGQCQNNKCRTIFLMYEIISSVCLQYTTFMLNITGKDSLQLVIKCCKSYANWAHYISSHI